MTDTRWVIATDGMLIENDEIDIHDAPEACMVCGASTTPWLTAHAVTREGKVMSYFCEACGSTMRRAEE